MALILIEKVFAGKSARDNITLELHLLMPFSKHYEEAKNPFLRLTLVVPSFQVHSACISLTDLPQY